MSKVIEYTVADFRGISGSITVELTGGLGSTKGTSLILYGDNGSGKSSLVDALEFALRGRLSRRGAEGKKFKREVRNLASTRYPGVVLELDDGRIIRRGGGLAGSSVPVTTPRQIMEGFQFSPVIIRRQDIESFWRVSEVERQAFFFDYFRDYTSIVSPDIAAKLRTELQESIAQHERAVAHIRSITDLPERTFPTTYRATGFFLQRTLLPRFGRQRHGSGRRFLPPELWNAFLELQSAILKKNYLAGSVDTLPDPAPIVDRDLSHILQNLSARVTTDFALVSRLDWVDQVTIVAGSGSELSITLRLSNGETIDPVQVLSEASLDLLALLILLEVHVECSVLGQKRVIVLDDVFQSVDTINRIRVLDHVLKRLKGWQVIITLHDRLWLELVRKAMHRASHPHILREVIPGGFGEAPRLRGARGQSVEELRRYITDRESSESVAGSAGRVLEELCDGLSISLASRITRRPGDRYTLGDLWPGIASALAKHGEPAMKEAATEVTSLMDLRNLIGAHYNEWAIMLASEEALDFGNAILELWDACACPTCHALFSKFISTDGKSVTYAWPCKCQVASAEPEATSQEPETTPDEAAAVNPGSSTQD